MNYTESQLWQIAEGRRLHRSTIVLLVVGSVFWLVHMIFGWEHHLIAYVLFFFVGVVDYFHQRLRAFSVLLKGESKRNSFESVPTER